MRPTTALASEGEARLVGALDDALKPDAREPREQAGRGDSGHAEQRRLCARRLLCDPWGLDEHDAKEEQAEGKPPAAPVRWRGQPERQHEARREG